MGGPGSGKTYSLSTLIASGLELFVIGTETRFKESLSDAIKARGLDASRLHTRLIQPLPGSFESLIYSADLVNTLSFDSLTKVGQDPGKPKYRQWISLLQCLSNFRDDSGAEYGPVDSWCSDRALAIDSLSGLNLMAMDLVVGTKPVKAPGEWQIAMEALERLLNMLTSSVKCLFVLTAHLEREVDEISGGHTIQAGALGRKLSPKIPRFFSEVIHTRREGTGYFWSTTSANFELKRRVLPLSDKIEPTFKPIVDAWRTRA